jgi:hypothetical protein
MDIPTNIINIIKDMELKIDELEYINKTLEIKILSSERSIKQSSCK